MRKNCFICWEADHRLDAKVGGSSKMSFTNFFATQEGIPDSIPAEMCYFGRQESLDKLKRSAEPNVPDA